MTISKFFPSTEGRDTFYVIVPGLLKVGFVDEYDPFGDQSPPNLEITPEQKEFLSGTVLHSLVEKDTVTYLKVNVSGKIYNFPIPPIELNHLEPRAIYDATNGTLLGTRLRLPGLYVNANAVQKHHSAGRPAELNNLYLSYSSDLTRAIDTSILRTRISPGLSGPVMGGDVFLKKGQVAITRSLANSLLGQIQFSLDDDKKSKLSKKRADFGDHILNGYKMIVLRNPTTVKGACQKCEIFVVDSPGAAIYMTSKDIDSAGGDFDGDQVCLLDFQDTTGNKLYEHCISSKNTKYLKKKEDFSKATTVVNKSGKKRKLSLLNLTWVPEKQQAILEEFKEKDLIGKAWYALVHYNYLTSHFIPSGKNKEEILNNRLNIIRDKALKGDNEIITQFYREFIDQNPVLDWEDKTVYKNWTNLAYIANSEVFFPVYELIFDLRKGDGTPPYRPTECISALMGYSYDVDWEGMEKGKVWTELLRSVYTDLPKVVSQTEKVQVDITTALEKHVAFHLLVNRRKNLTASRQFASVQELGAFIKDPSNFVYELSSSLLLGTEL